MPTLPLLLSGGGILARCSVVHGSLDFSAAGFLETSERPGFLMANIMVTDVAAAKHYQQITVFPYAQG